MELFADPQMSRALVFTRTKRGADKVARHLEAAGIRVAAIHGNKSQSQRERALAAFRAAKIRALVATDIAARGIDIDQVTHVVNFELPDVPESYVHRIGRTARAGAAGIAISLCDAEERELLRDIERLTRQSIPAEDRRHDTSASAPGRSAGRQVEATHVALAAVETGTTADRARSASSALVPRSPTSRATGAAAYRSLRRAWPRAAGRGAARQVVAGRHGLAGYPGGATVAESSPSARLANEPQRTEQAWANPSVSPRRASSRGLPFYAVVTVAQASGCLSVW